MLVGGLDFALDFALDLGNEAKAAAVDGLDEVWVAGVVSQGPTQLGDHLRQRFRRDRQPGPDRIEQFVSCHETACVLDQISKHLEGLGSQLDRRVPAAEAFVFQVELERRERDQQSLSSPALRMGIIHKSNLSLRTSQWRFSDDQGMDSAPAPAHARVFVIQLSGDAEPKRDHIVGRLEHVDSGQSIRFTSNREMIEFFARILCEEEGPPPGCATGGRSK